MKIIIPNWVHFFLIPQGRTSDTVWNVLLLGPYIEQTMDKRQLKYYRGVSCSSSSSSSSISFNRSHPVVLQYYSYILIPSENTTYKYQQIDNILEFWQHVLAVKSHHQAKIEQCLGTMKVYSDWSLQSQVQACTHRLTSGCTSKYTAYKKTEHSCSIYGCITYQIFQKAHLCDIVPLYPALTAWRRAYHIVSKPTLDEYGGMRDEGNIYIPDISVC